MIPRYYNQLDDYVRPRKVLIIYGPRQVGKTTLIENYLESCPYKYRFDSGENIRIQEVLNSLDFDRLKSYAEGYELIVIDEAQHVENIGQALKILVDVLPDIRIIVSGSSSFTLSQAAGEPLTGRKRTLHLYPIAQMELLNIENKFDLQNKLENYLLYGQYPDVLLAESKKEKISLLNEFVDSYLLKDILAIDNIKRSDTLLVLLKLLAFQVGQLVSPGELATQCRMDIKTTARYLDLLEKSFVIVKLGGYSGNLRKEVTSKCKYLFVDNGIRNAIISQFNSLDSRNDVGGLWENFLIMERIKKATYEEYYGERYYWRTYDKKEIDYIESYDDNLNAYEIKWSSKVSITKIKQQWLDKYPKATFTFLNRDNYWDFIA
jgi:predicted AAA+ superfamily ATPase